MAATVRHGAAQGCRRQCGRGGGAEATEALTPAACGSRGEVGEAGRCAVPRRRAHRGEGAASDGVAAVSLRRLAGNGGVCAG
jgi:hypothetical protein